MLSPKTGWISWLHFQKCQAPAALIAVGDAGALRMKSSSQVFSAVDLPSCSLFKQDTVLLLFCVKTTETWGLSLLTWSMGSDGVIQPLGRDINCALCVWKTEIWLQHVFYFSQLISHRNHGAGWCVCPCPAPHHRTWFGEALPCPLLDLPC